MPGAAVVAVERADRRRARRAAGRARAAPPSETAPQRRRRGSSSTASSRLRGIGTVATGTLWSGSIAEGDRAARRAGGLRRARAVRAGARRPVDARRGGPARRASTCPGSSGAGRGAATRSSSRVRIPASYRLDIALEELEPSPARASGPPRHGGARRACRAPATVRPAPARGAGRSRRAATASCCDRHDGRRRTRPRPGAAAPARAGPCAPRGSGARGDRAAARARARQPGHLRRRGSTAGELARGPRRPQAGGFVSPPSGSPSFASACGRSSRHGRGEPLDPGIPVAELLPGRHGRRPSSPCSASSGAAEGVPARRGSRASATRGGRRRAREGSRRRSGEGRGPRARAVPRGARAARPARRRLRDVAGAVRARPRGARAALEAGPITLARSATARRRAATAQLLLERFDADGLTRRVGDQRVLRRSRPARLRPYVVGWVATVSGGGSLAGTCSGSGLRSNRRSVLPSSMSCANRSLKPAANENSG